MSITLSAHFFKVLAFTFAATTCTPGSLLIHAQFN
jgi:hypothetical protein